MKHPGAYQLLFERPDPSSALGDQGPGVDLLGLLAAPLRELGFDADEAQMRSLTLWAALHGITSLRIHKPSAPWNRPATADIAAVIAPIAAPGRAS